MGSEGSKDSDMESRKSGGMKTSFEKSGRGGQIVKSATGRDDSSFPINDQEARVGRKMGGGLDNLSHSLTGASAVQGVRGKTSGEKDTR